MIFEKYNCNYCHQIIVMHDLHQDGDLFVFPKTSIIGIERAWCKPECKEAQTINNTKLTKLLYGEEQKDEKQ